MTAVIIIVIVSTMLYSHYNNYNYNNYLILPSPQHLVTTMNHYSEVDKFGVKEIYPTKIGGEEWFMNMRDIAHDNRTLFTATIPTLTKNPDGSWRVSSPEVQYNIFTSSGYRPESITTLNQKQLATKDTCNHPMIGRM